MNCPHCKAVLPEDSALLLQEARDYILHKARRHDLYWKDGHSIIDRIDALRLSNMNKEQS